MKIRFKINLFFWGSCFLGIIFLLLFIWVYVYYIGNNASIYLGVFLGLFFFCTVAGWLLDKEIAKPFSLFLQQIDMLGGAEEEFKNPFATNSVLWVLAVKYKEMIEKVNHAGKIADLASRGQKKQFIQKNRGLEDQQLALLNILDDITQEKNISIHEKEKVKQQSKIIRLAMKEVEKNKRWFEFVLENVPIGIFIMGVKLTNPSFSNSFAKKILGKEIDFSMDPMKYSEEFDVVREDGSRYPAGDLPFIKCIKSHKQEYVSDIFLERLQGRVALKVISIPSFDKKGELVSVLTVFQDITKEFEVDKAKSEFVSLASHQLRTPLTIINWYAEILRGLSYFKVDKKYKMSVSEINKASVRMDDLVRSLLNVSRLELGTFSVDPEEVDVNELAKTAVGELKPQIKKKKMNITLDLSAKLPKMVLDKKLTFIIFQNLISNAVKYTPDKGKILIFTRFGKFMVKTLGKKKNGLLIKVVDNGYGIPQSQQYKVFDKLFRADNVTVKDVEGTGLGLYLVKSIVEYTGGNIWFVSKENKGTTFFVYIPAKGMMAKKGSKKIT